MREPGTLIQTNKFHKWSRFNDSTPYAFPSYENPVTRKCIAVSIPSAQLMVSVWISDTNTIWQLQLYSKAARASSQMEWWFRIIRPQPPSFHQAAVPVYCSCISEWIKKLCAVGKIALKYLSGLKMLACVHEVSKNNAQIFVNSQEWGLTHTQIILSCLV